MTGKVFIIAEIGVNHCGSLLIAKKMVDAAITAGADAVKFQAFEPDFLVSKFTPQADYQKKTGKKYESQLAMIKKFKLNPGDHKELIGYCRGKEIIFLSSPFDLKSIDLLDNLKIGVFKIPSGEITNLPYLEKIGRLNKKIIMSTGMADLKEIKDALDILIACGTKKENIIILHCNTEYPTPMGDVNLMAMLTIRDRFKVRVGYSDHTLGIEVPIAAVALGASVIEKHFTLNRNMEGPDHKASLEPAEFRQMVTAIRNIEESLGNGNKRPSKSELKNINIVRKSIIASRIIKKGEVFSEDKITAKRPGTGISPMRWDEVIGRTAKRNFAADELIEI